MPSKNDLKLLTLEQQIELINSGHLWCWTKLWIGLTHRLYDIVLNKEMVVFIIVSYMMLTTGDISDSVQWIGYLAMGTIFILAESLRVLIRKNTKMDVSIGAKFNKNIGGRINGESNTETT